MANRITEPVKCECALCKAKWTQYLAHYDIVLCKCGAFLWTLRPKRSGPLVMKPYPSAIISPGVRPVARQPIN